MFKYVFILTFLLWGCQTTQLSMTPVDVSHPQELYMDDNFLGFSAIEMPSEDEIFAVDESMKTLISRHVKKHTDIHKKTRALLEIILKPQGHGINYDINSNTTAIETFHSGRANCLSLTILSYALAKEANINVKFQDVIVPEYWINNGDYSLLAGHVNLAVTSQELTDIGDGWGHKVLEIDFDPDSIKKSFPRRTIHMKTVVAMLYNNTAAQALVNKQYVKAYALLKKATLSDPQFSSAWANLGVLYKHTEHIDMAEKAYRYAIQMNPDNYSALTNLVSILMSKENSHEAQRITDFLHEKRTNNPYYYAMLGGTALNAGDTASAVRHYKHAIKLNDDVHEFYYGLARVYSFSGNYAKAKASMIKALMLNEGKEIEAHYQHKLEFLTQASVSNSH